MRVQIVLIMRFYLFILFCCPLSFLMAEAHPIATQPKSASVKKIGIKKRKRVKKRKIRRQRPHFIVRKPLVTRRKRLRSLRKSPFLLSTTQTPVEFTKTYSKFFGVPYQSEEGEQITVKVWTEEHTMPFTELVPSWNALRPTQGSFVFKGSIKTVKGWTAWHSLAEWKSDSQLTFANTRAGDIHAKHVKFEVPHGMRGHGFRIKVEAKGGADICNVHALFGCVSDFSKYKVDPGIKALPQVLLKDVPRQSQMVLNHPRSKDLCCPTSMAMIVRYFNSKYDQHLPTPLHQEAIDFADAAHDKGIDIYGSWALNVAQAYDAGKGRVYFRVERLNSFKDLHEYLMKKIPVSVSVRGMLRGGAKTYSGGHYMVVIGWNPEKETVLCIDPAFGASKRTLRSYDVRHFLAAWSRSNNMSYISLPREGFEEDFSV